MGEGLAFRKFVTAGTWCVDYNKLIDDWPQEGNVTEILEIHRAGGGSACNFAIDLKRLDPSLDISTMGVVGDDDNGSFLIECAKSNGIDTSGLKVVSRLATPFTDAYTNRRNGKRTHIFRSGASAALSPEDFDFTNLAGSFLHLGLPGAHATLDNPCNGDATGWVTVLRKARAAGLTTNIELMSIDDRCEIARLNRPSLPYLDMLIVNDIEIGALAGEETIQNGLTDVAACKRAAANILETGAMQFVAVHYPAGAICLTKDGAIFEKPSLSVPPDAILGANGAGDAFVSGFIYGVAHKSPIDDCLAYAHAAAAASMRDSTTTGAVVGITECMALADKWGWANQ